MNLNHYPYSSQRRVILGKQGAVATSQPLATIAGMEMLLAGGNAVDAAIAMAIALTVVEPTSNGIGGDAFAIVWAGKLFGLNASGKSPQKLNQATFLDKKTMPELGWPSVTVPGAVSAWRALWEKWGKLPFEQLFTPAIRYAEQGFPVSPVTAASWQEAAKIYLPLQGKEYQAFQQVFFPQQKAPTAGEIWASPGHASTLKALAASGGESFYSGKLAQAIANFAADTGGDLTLADLANHQAMWVDPIMTNYRDYSIWEMPPNTQGIATLMALNILEGFDLKAHPRESTLSYHRQIEAMKLAFADVYSALGDPSYMKVSTKELLDKNYARLRRKLITKKAISIAEPGLPNGGTVYLAAADQDLMVSFIQSNYHSFGSGILIPETGIALQNRASGFTLAPGHPNELAPNKRPFHTIIPGFITRNGQPIGPFGVMGAPMQPQGHLQVIVNLIDYQMNPQAALDAPRWRFLQDNQVLLESNVIAATELAQWGHQINIAPANMFGKGQIIWREQGVLMAGSEPRSDGLALAI